jgi:hypothetical protein
MTNPCCCRIGCARSYGLSSGTVRRRVHDLQATKALGGQQESKEDQPLGYTYVADFRARSTARSQGPFGRNFPQATLVCMRSIQLPLIPSGISPSWPWPRYLERFFPIDRRNVDMTAKITRNPKLLAHSSPTYRVHIHGDSLRESLHRISPV